jgi:hypothetical protein
MRRDPFAACIFKASVVISLRMILESQGRSITVIDVALAVAVGEPRCQMTREPARKLLFSLLSALARIMASVDLQFSVEPVS